MSTFTIVLIIVLAVMVAGFIVLFLLGKRAQKKKAEQDEQLAAAAQSVTMLIIDKKRMKIRDSGLPQSVIEQTPKRMRGAKLPIVKAKVGSRVMTLIADEAIYDTIPLKKEVRASVSGIYITKVSGLRGALEAPQGKKSFRARMRDRQKRASDNYERSKQELAAQRSKNKKGKASSNSKGKTSNGKSAGNKASSSKPASSKTTNNKVSGSKAAKKK